MKDEVKIEYLKIMENIIDRMGKVSFQEKCWFVTLSSASFALWASSGKWLFLFLIVCLCLVFWYFDTFYLRQERLYRKLYESVAKDEPQNYPFCLSTNQYEHDAECTYGSVAFSKTIWPFYLLPICCIAFYYVGKYVTHCVVPYVYFCVL